MTVEKKYTNAADESKHWEKREGQAGFYVDFLKKETGDLLGKKILDVGCASGIEVNAFKQAGGLAEGVDLNEAFILEARKKFPDIRFEVGDITKLPYVSESFDVVFCINTLFYTKIDGSIPELLRILKRGGYCLVTVDTEIVNIDEDKVIHTESIESIEKVARDVGCQIKKVSEEQVRHDETPFRHVHHFRILIINKP